MFNKVIIVGNLTRDVDLKYLPSGSAIATIGLASNYKYTKQDGSKGEDVCFVDVKLFGRVAEITNQYLHRGSKVLIEGRLNFESWTDQSGQKRSRHTIIAENMKMLDSRPDRESGGYGGGYDSGYDNGGGYGNMGGSNGGYGSNYNSYGNNGGSYNSSYSSQYQKPQNMGTQGSQMSSAMSGGMNGAGNMGGSMSSSNSGNTAQNIPEINIDDDDIPF